MARMFNIATGHRNSDLVQSENPGPQGQVRVQRLSRLYTVS
jgi:hypothetical protein